MSNKSSTVAFVLSVTVYGEPTALIVASYVATPLLPLFGKPPIAGAFVQFASKFQLPEVVVLQVEVTTAAKTADDDEMKIAKTASTKPDRINDEGADFMIILSVWYEQKGGHDLARFLANRRYRQTGVSKRRTSACNERKTG